jgi:hypothetical protein
MYVLATLLLLLSSFNAPAPDKTVHPDPIIIVDK